MIFRLAFAASIAVIAAAIAQSDPGSDENAQVYNAIRNNDLQGLATLIKNGGLTAADSDGDTPLMIAAAVGSPESVRLLLDAGANPNAMNKVDATPLMWCAADAAKVKLLLDKGAYVNAKSKFGHTALQIAASYDGPIAAVRLLIDKGADVNAVDGGGAGVLESAAGSNNLETAKLLIAKGAKVNVADLTGFTPLIVATGNGCRNGAMVELLVRKGAYVRAKCAADTGAVKNGPVKLGQITALHQAAQSNFDAAKTLVEAGAFINAKDVRGYTPLVWAVATDHADPRIVKLLLENDADREPALAWARRYQNPEVLRLLGLKYTPSSEMPCPVSTEDPRLAACSALSVAQAAAANFHTTGGCISCHAQNMTADATYAAKECNIKADYAVNDKIASDNEMTNCAPYQQLMQLQGPPAGPDGMERALLQMYAANKTPNLRKDSILRYILSAQTKEGDWPMNGSVRPPLEDGSFSDTAMGIRVMRLYSIPALQSEVQSRIALAADWLLHAKPTTTEDRTTQILGLVWAGEKPPSISLSALINRQRSNGGWGQTEQLPADAYATGEALWALHEAGVPSTNAAFKRGEQFLLRTQQPDGTWHVVTRALSFQPYFQSGFPYGHDQWISQAGTALAAKALTFASD
jgi:ankyrin repeat protein